MAIDYFTKWVTTEAYTIVNQSDTINFVWKHLIYQFGVPRELVVDNGTQFQNNKLKELCNTYHIRLNFAFVSYSQSNGQAEATNKIILNMIKKSFEQSKGKWVEELPRVLWAYKTTKRSSVEETPFAMVYSIEAVIPIEIGLPTLRSDIVDRPDINQNQLLLNLDLGEETRQIAQIKLASYQQQARNFYAQKVKPYSFAVGDQVLHRIPTPQTKLQSNWEGPFEIAEVVGNSAYRLREIHRGKPIPKTQNALYLRKYYIYSHILYLKVVQFSDFSNYFAL